MANQKNSFTGERIKLNNVRLSFPTLVKPEAPKGYENSDPKFSANFLLDPQEPGNRAAIKAISAELNRIMKEFWGGKPPRMRPITCFGKGELFTNSQSGQPYEGYEGKFAVAAANKRRPTLVDRDKTQLTPEEAGQKLYAGCYVDAIINFWATNTGGQAIWCSLGGIRFRADGEEFGAGSVSADEFDDLDGDTGEVDLGLDDELGLDDNLDESGTIDDFDDDILF